MTTNDSRFLVMGITGLVQFDLIGAIAEHFPAAQAVTVETESEAIEAAKQPAGVEFAFLNIGPDDFAASDLSSLFGALKTKVILLGDAAEEAASNSPFPVLMRPFSGDDVLGLLGYNP
ncbi:hypothetical protein HKX54_07880 [Sulfitobacter sp. M57]|uniref:hypothetical protein n=1 Tax=unclassified Sulfitobacter TaxID=196795 RepID=UPI0023E32D0E|nr:MULTISPECIES: hypothetical protein [unclassified Sulfitobacter]MDF3414371.1 hypothetical protein [Sulfitobacter sp. KE5]MDF3420347.1 hypothetical protein [Sulfitobacter sp. KE43]MDF3432917.1 hypothetical protein [Sulfitobacter sp. KE42]MDF3458557.1 hypothetical protein [Sulfitobacter sp. S74]MDF3462457.1 hypothetical protein [Sulfitobacter sp. Ks18]